MEKTINTQSYINYIKKSNILEVISYDPIRPSCNNRCKFCITKDCLIPPQSIKELSISRIAQYKWIKDTIIPQLKENELLDIKCNFQMIGGELFYLPEEYYDEYYLWLKTGWDLLYPLLSHTPVVNLFTNLLFNDDIRSRFINFYHKCNKLLGKYPNIATSFDLWGRFNTKIALQNWLETTKALEKEIPSNTKIYIETLLITPTLELYLNDEDNEVCKIFDSLLENPKYHVTLQEYVPNSKEQIDQLIPNKELILKFFKKIYDKHPNCGIIENYKVSDFNKIKPTYYYNNCHALTFNVPGWTQEPYHHKCMEDGSVPIDSCIYTQYHNMPNYDINKDFDKTMPVKGVICLDYPEIVDEYFNKLFKCDFCKYSNVCNRYCMGVIALNDMKKECWKKSVYELINNEIL